MRLRLGPLETHGRCLRRAASRRRQDSTPAARSATGRAFRPRTIGIASLLERAGGAVSRRADNLYGRSVNDTALRAIPQPTDLRIQPTIFSRHGAAALLRWMSSEGSACSWSARSPSRSTSSNRRPKSRGSTRAARNWTAWNAKHRFRRIHQSCCPFVVADWVAVPSRLGVRRTRHVEPDAPLSWTATKTFVDRWRTAIAESGASSPSVSLYRSITCGGRQRRVAKQLRRVLELGNGRRDPGAHRNVRWVTSWNLVGCLIE